MAISLATEAGAAGNYPAYRFNTRERKLLQVVKTYVDNSAPNNVITTEGDIIVGDSSGDAERLAIGADHTVLMSDGTTLEYGLVDTDNLESGAVTLAKLDAGITPSHRIIAAGKFTTAGGDATESITATGATGTDIAFVTLQTAGASPVSVRNAIPTTDAITVTMSGDPSTDHILSWQVLRAVS